MDMWCMHDSRLFNWIPTNLLAAKTSASLANDEDACSTSSKPVNVRPFTLHIKQKSNRDNYVNVQASHPCMFEPSCTQILVQPAPEYRDAQLQRSRSSRQTIEPSRRIAPVLLDISWRWRTVGLRCLVGTTAVRDRCSSRELVKHPTIKCWSFLPRSEEPDRSEICFQSILKYVNRSMT